jgi:hypothetical protein
MKQLAMIVGEPFSLSVKEGMDARVMRFTLNINVAGNLESHRTPF